MAAASATDKVYVLMGTTGQVGGYALKHLHEAKVNVRAILRNDTKSAAVRTAGATSIAIGDVSDSKSLTSAFSGAEGIYVMLPPNPDPNPGFATERGYIDAVITGILNASPRPKRVVFLSTIGAQVSTRESILYPAYIFESELRAKIAPTISVVSVRAGGFVENTAWQLSQAKSEAGIVYSHFNVDQKSEMVSVADIGRVVAEQLLLPSLPINGFKVIELEGPEQYSPTDVGAVLTKLLGKPVKYVMMPRDQWETNFRKYGMKNPQFYMAMYDGRNEGVFGFEGGATNVHVKGTVTLEAGLRTLLAKPAAPSSHA